MGVLGMESQ
jgi:hypothetical protein